MDDDLADLGENINWKKIEDPKSYYPTRLEYFSGKIVMAMLQGRSEKAWRSCVKTSVELASELEKEIDRFNSKES